jgi:hypothetical protein
MLNYIDYSLLFIKIWGINKLLLGVPFYLIEHLILSNIIKLTYRGGKYFIYKIGYFVIPQQISIVDVPDNSDISISNINNDVPVMHNNN